MQTVTLSYLITSSPGHTLETRRSSTEVALSSSPSMMKGFCNSDEELPPISFSPEPTGLQPASAKSPRQPSSWCGASPNETIQSSYWNNQRRVKCFILKYKKSIDRHCCLFTWGRSRREFGFLVNLVLFSSFNRLVKCFLFPPRRILWRMSGMQTESGWRDETRWVREREMKQEITSHVHIWGLGLHVQRFHAP